MNAFRKLRKGLSILRNSGLRVFLRALRAHLGASERAGHPDESRIAFEVLEAENVKGLMIDVGAHSGNSLALFARSGWRVLCFEPDSENRRRLLRSYACFPNVTIDPRAVSDHAQEGAILYRSKVSTGISGLSAFHPSHLEAEKVDVTTLESFMEEQGIADQTLDFLKVDTEGFDLFALKGIPWSRSSPRLILCEFEDLKTVPLGYSFHDLAGFLQAHGYRLVVSEWHPIEHYGGPHQWRRFATYPCELESSRAWGNILAVREAKLYDSLLTICKVNS